MPYAAKSARACWAAIESKPEENFEAVSTAIAAFADRPNANNLEELLTLLPTGAHAGCSAIESKREFGKIWALTKEPTV
ncbi:hypothetical protein N9L71_01220 [Verrucomicrobiales bacterium]|nr:hypothetical protein [Verrucomicrobiales bacterium]